MPRCSSALLAAGLVFLLGCGGGNGNQPEFEKLHPVNGVVKRGGQPVKGGAVTFFSDSNDGKFLVNSSVEPDGTFELSTVRTTDTRGERRTGAPAGTYKVQYAPPAGDQATANAAEPIDLPSPVIVKAGDNDLTIDLPRK